MSGGFEVADRVRVIATGETGSVAAVYGPETERAGTVDVLPDGASLTAEYAIEELEAHDGPPVERVVDPVRQALVKVGDEIRKAMPEAAGVAAAFDDLQAAITTAAPELMEIDDGFGNGWTRCGPGCDLEVVRPGKVQCSGARCGEAKK